jgi:transmembrane sensor
MDRASNVDSEREAAAWHDRLNRDRVSDETQRAFAEWLAQSPRHRTLYDAIDGVWSRLRGAAEDQQMLALRHETALRLTRRTTQTVRPLRWAATGVLVAAVSVAILVSVRSSGDRSLIISLRDAFRLGNTGHYETATGERLAFTLSDGSQVTLDTQSDLKVSFSPAERSVHLTSGQAFFEVAKDPRRPFVVEVRNRRFVAVGTAFDVRVDGDQVRVTMIEGTVRVEGGGEGVATSTDPGIPTRQPASQPANRDRLRSEIPVVTTITAGEQLITDAKREDHVRAADPERSTSWRRGQLIFDDTRLADAIVEVNRYSEAKIELADPELGDLRLSGAFATGRPTVFVEAVTTYFPVRVVRSDDRAVVLGSKK